MKEDQSVKQIIVINASDRLAKRLIIDRQNIDELRCKYITLVQNKSRLFRH